NVIIIFFFAAIIFCLPVFLSLGNWGIHDWDQQIFWRAMPRHTLFAYKQFPFWDPYVNGGGVYFAHPHACFLNPMFLLSLPFKPEIGVKIEILVYFLIGLLGTYVLGRSLGMSNLGAYLAAFVYMCSSYLSLHVAEGHTCYLLMALVVWVFFFYVRALSQYKDAVFAIILLVWIQFAGGVHIFTAAVFLLFIFSAAKSIEARNIKPLLIWMTVIGGTFLLGAVNFIPMLGFIRDYPRPINDLQGIGPNMFYHMFLDRNQAGLFLASYKNTIVGIDPDYQKRFGLLTYWTAYGFYIGYIPLFLLLPGILFQFKKRWPLIVTGLILFIVVLVSKSPFGIVWNILHRIPIYNYLRPSSGHAGNAILMMALVIGLFFTRIQ
ncbi:MAG: hypothetical protein AAB276_00040, partial [Pseudomonadota bacterium]